jgi:hypothetical protein
MVAIAIMFNAVWRYAAWNHRLLIPDADANAVEGINKSYILGPVIYAVATLLALVNAWISLVLFAGLAAYYLLPVSGPRTERVVVRGPT